jgi:hypothetical protein
MRRPARTAAIITAGAALLACGTAGVAAATTTAGTGTGAAAAAKTFRYFGFDINNGGTDPGFISAPGTNPATFAQGDELIINDQVTTTHLVKGGYPIVGFDSGVCTLTRIPEKNAEQTIGDCVATVVLKGGSLTVQGAIRFQAKQPEAGTLAVTGGTGSYDGVTGQVGVSFTKNYKILAFRLT